MQKKKGHNIPFVWKMGYLCKETYKNASTLAQKMFLITLKGDFIQKDCSQQVIKAPDPLFSDQIGANLCFFYEKWSIHVNKCDRRTSNLNKEMFLISLNKISSTMRIHSWISKSRTPKFGTKLGIKLEQKYVSYEKWAIYVSKREKKASNMN